MGVRAAKNAAYIVGVAAAMLGLWLTGRHSYLLFHSLAELTSIGMAGAMFAVAWHSRKFSANDYLTYLGIAFLSVACLDLMHTLAYKGLGVFPGYGADLPTRLWIAGRGLEALALLISPVFLFKRLRPWPALLAHLAAVALLLALIFPLKAFPSCYVEGGLHPGLTPFKIGAEYVICACLLAGMGILRANRARLSPNVFLLMMTAMTATILSELAFTRYVSVYGDFNIVGHLLKVVAFLLFYKATVEASLTEPYHVLFRDLSRREAALRAGEERYRTTVESIGDGVITTDDKGVVTFMNRVAEELTGRGNDAYGRSLDEVFTIINEKTREAMENPLNRALREGSVVGLANHASLISRDGREIPIEDSAAPIRGDDGEIRGAVMVFHDITERRRVQDALRESERRLIGVLESMPDAFVSFDADMRYTYVNANAERLQAVGREELLGKDARVVYPDEESCKTISQYERVMREQEPVTSVSYHGGFDRWVEVTAFPTPDGVSVFYKDVSAQVKAEEALRASEQRWATTLSSIGDAVIATDIDGRITFMNGEAESLTGWGLDEAAHRPVGDVFRIINEQTRKEVESPVAKVLREGTVVGLANHTILMKKDGSEVPIDDSGAPIRVKDGETTGVVLVFRDITGRKAAEDALAESEARYRTLFGNMTEEVHLWKLVRDGGGRVSTWRLVDANPPALRTWGRTLDETEGKTADEIFGPGATDRYMAIVQKVMTENAAYSYEDYFPNLDKYFRFTAIPLGDYLIITGADISIYKHAEKALKGAHDELEQRVRERTAGLRRQADLLELAYEAIIVRDLEDRIIFWNGRAEELYGWTKAEALGNVTHTLFNTKFPMSLYDCTARLKKENRWEGELTHTAKDGRPLTIISRQALQRDETGQPLAVLEINLDVTEARRTEAQLRQAQKMEALGVLSGGIAHDFNNILAAIIGFGELIRDHTPKGSHDMRRAQRVVDAALRGRELVRQLLIYSRQTEHEKKPVLLSSILKETVKLVRPTTPTTISIRTTVASESGLVLADPTQIHQVVMNLCANAAHAMQEKGGVLDIELCDFSVGKSNGHPHGIKPGLYMKLTVSDTGIGMPPEVVEKIFDPFFTTKGVGEGTGLGLSVVHGIVEQSNGYITVESEPGRGSCFTVYFPKVAEQAKPEAPKENEVPVGFERVLFVDDEEALVEMGEEVLAELGYEVTSKMSSGQALALLREDPSRFDLVITDQTMPEMTGIDLAREVLSLRPDMPIIMCTGYSHIVDADKARAAGIRAFVMKPLTKKEIARTIRQVLQG